ncbi:glycine oxidase ThiO [Ramlibacter monticola]|uniref:FAD-dependent oxidoreductase n=1 Tax=Ramlibacter monticola TaxID=1926872 RepID=A0A936Z549_9BURK|nr:FAD-dependent oxidoreductase [Ramlibacter monticola]MBL0395198.1 FAD-dependent oxidoreductase [Ramlibacter monticola]
MKIGIAGAGLLGRLLAFQLGRAGHEVHVFDPAAHAEARGAAGWTAAGMLSPVAELECADEGVFALGVRSIALWPELLGQLQVPVEFRREGSLLVAHRGDEGAARRVVEVLEEKMGALDSRLRGNEGMRRLEPQELRELEPAIRGPAHAWLIPGEGRIHPVQAMQALAAAASGVQWHWGRAVDAVHPGELHTSGGTPRFDHVFDVRGTGARPQLAVRGVRGEIFWLHAPGVDLRRPVRLLHPRHRVYLVPREGELVVVGASEIESEDRSPVSLRSTVELLAAAHSVLPELAEARIVHSESNLRPALPDNLPLLQSQRGLTRINGLFRHGWLIAPALVEQALQELKP